MSTNKNKRKGVERHPVNIGDLGNASYGETDTKLNRDEKNKIIKQLTQLNDQLSELDNKTFTHKQKQEKAQNYERKEELQKEIMLLEAELGDEEGASKRKIGIGAAGKKIDWEDDDSRTERLRNYCTSKRLTNQRAKGRVGPWIRKDGTTVTPKNLHQPRVSFNYIDSSLIIDGPRTRGKKVDYAELPLEDIE